MTLYSQIYLTLVNDFPDELTFLCCLSYFLLNAAGLTLDLTSPARNWKKDSLVSKDKNLERWFIVWLTLSAKSFWYP